MISRKSTLLILGLMSFGIFSCNSDSGMNSTVIESSSSPSSTVPVPIPLPSNRTSNSTEIIDQSKGTVFYPPTRLGQFLSPSVTGLNPAHGQPGHDCAVAVGAPLRSTAAVPTAAANVTSVIPTGTNQVVLPAPKNSSGLKINPAHGQPGHDCAVAVGAPLGGSASVPAKVSTNTVSLPTESQSAAPIPNFGANLKVNPAHGKPGHDCSIAVGDPLPTN